MQNLPAARTIPEVHVSSNIHTKGAVMTNNNAIYSTMVRAGKTTYFIDVREAKNGQKYLSISESKVAGDEKKRTTIRVFGETVDVFRQAIEEAASACNS